MTQCEFYERCWRYAYTRYLQERKDYPQGIPPDRATMVLEGFASLEMGKVTTDPRTGKKRYGGIGAISMPLPDGQGWCPAAQGLYHQDCNEYRREQAYRAKWDAYKQARIKEQYERFPDRQERAWIPRAVRQYVSKRDKFTCVYCCRYYADLKELGIKTVVDHVIPLAQGGSSTEDNLVFSCAECNREKGTEIWQPGCRAGMV